ncbi:universal stress protein [Salinirubellus sp. GCM10025818]|jgi:nucleotide-binding universal stress UspA family protein|uniref:universal stress protein n=1 Tax=Salinirubellus TaxID=2162630 RepID=UPI0030CF969A
MSRVVVPVAVLKGEAVPLGLMNLLGTMDVTVLGYHVLPEQTPPDQARQQYEDRANAALADITEEFRDAGGDADYRLVFTTDRPKTVRRVADEVGARAYAITGATGAVDRLLVSLSGDVATDRILEFVTELVGDRAIEVTLLRVAGDEGATPLENARSRLEDAGISARTVLAEEAGPLDALLAALPDHDAIVMGEQAPSLQSFLFGDVTDRVAAESVGPVLVVRREPAEQE